MSDSPYFAGNRSNACGRTILVLVTAGRTADAEPGDDFRAPLDRDRSGKRDEVRSAHELGAVWIFGDKLNETAHSVQAEDGPHGHDRISLPERGILRVYRGVITAQLNDDQARRVDNERVHGIPPLCASLDRG